MLEIFSGNVKREIFWIYDSSNKAKILGDELIAIIHNEHSSDVEFDVVLLLLGFEHIEGGSLGHKDDWFEFQSSFNWELLDCEVVLPIVSQTLVEVRVLVLADFFLLFHPNGLVLVELFEFSWNFLDLLLLLFLVVLFNLDIFSFLLFFILIIRNLFFCCLLNLKRNGEWDEFGVLLD